MNPSLRTLSAPEVTKKRHELLSGRKQLSQMATVARISIAVSDIKKREERIKPTPERLAKGDIAATIDPVDGRRYGPRQSVVDRYRGKWNEEMEWAFDRLVEDSRAGDITNVTMNFDATGTRAAGSKLGGLGNAHWLRIEKYNRFQFVMDHMPPRFRRVAEWLLIPRDANDKPMALEDVGRWIFPHFKDATSLRMLGIGYLLACGDKLVSLYAHWDMETRVAEIRYREKQIG